MSRHVSVRKVLAALVCSTIFGFSTVPAEAGTYCGYGNVVAVAVRWPNAPVSGDDPILSIGIRHTDTLHPAGTVIYYSSKDTGNIDGSAWIRAILQLATLGMSTGAVLSVSSDDSCTGTVIDNKRWVTKLGGAWLANQQ